MRVDRRDSLYDRRGETLRLLRPSTSLRTKSRAIAEGLRRPCGPSRNDEGFAAGRRLLLSVSELRASRWGHHRFRHYCNLSSYKIERLPFFGGPFYFCKQ